MGARHVRTNTNRAWFATAGIVVLAWFFSAGLATASPWTEVGDDQLRADINLLAASGVIDNVTTQWPIPWGGVLARLDQPDSLKGQPAYVVAAAQRVHDRGYAETGTGRIRYNATFDLTNNPSVVRGFETTARQDVQGIASAELTLDSTAIRLAVGARSTNPRDHQVLVLDNSYIAQRIGNAAVYAGYMTHWWGPGHFSALSLSNNARPFPQVGITRISTAPFESPWLSWIGPWQAEFFVGWLDGPRVVRNTLYNGLRVTFSPLPGLEIGLARTDQFCGEGHVCKPIATYFNFTNDPGHPSPTNDEGVFDVRYTNKIRNVPFEIYTQIMNEDSSPITHSGSSHLFGASIWLPFSEATARLTVEYTDTVATRDIFSFGNYLYGFTYNNFMYADGMRYRGNAMGFSLDNDSRLATVQFSMIDKRNVTYSLTYHHANVSSANPISRGMNVLTPVPVTINMGEARLSVPYSTMRFQLVGRLQDNQLPPDHGFAAAVEAIVSLNL